VRDGNITSQLAVAGSVDVNSTGVYKLTYTVKDKASNNAIVTRTVTVTGSHTMDLNATVAMDMIWCQPGTFTMGSPTTEVGRGINETEHNVSLTKGFYLGKYEVTQAQYEAVMKGNIQNLSSKPSSWINHPNRPVERVSWDDAQVFLTRLNAQQSDYLPAGWSYVLPTESQWEYACRAGTTTAFSWGNTISPTDANWNHGSDPNRAVEVGQFSANPWGFFDMHGNVWEWTADWYRLAYPSGNPVVDPVGPALGSQKVRRGGAWDGDLKGLRSAKRLYFSKTNRFSFLGFRLAFQKIQPDTANPEIQLIGGNTITHSQGMPFTDPGAEAHDVRDGNITSQLAVAGSVDVNSTGTYLLTYTVQDGAGNTCHRYPHRSRYRWEPHRGSKCHRSDGHDLVSARDLYNG
jgi:formylglycine-generating enzyme required for sulfatase activity